ncbi:S41 family peptidase [Chitinophaga sp.]|uniref:S41 family peptidase n=1 Tax=Chitinophaga sp. TaxID=1869181 RepID=UPI0031DB4D2C
MKAIVFLLACLVFNKPQAKYAPQEVKADLEYLYTTLQEVHYNLYVNMPKTRYDSAYHQLYNSIKDSMTALEVTRLFQPFLALGEVAHCNMAFPGALYFDSVIQHTNYLFPLTIEVVKGKTVVTNNFSNDQSIKAGDEITFDGIDNATAMVAGESRAMRNTLVDLFTFPRIYWWRFGSQQTFNVKINKRPVTLKGVLAYQLEKQLQTIKPPFNTAREFRMIGDIAYLHPGIFLNNESSGNTSEHTTFQNNEFINFIDSAYLKIHAAHPKNLVIDLRGNPGGDNSFSDPMIAYFADKPFWFCQSFSIRTSAITKQFWKDVSDTSLQNLKQQILSHKDGDTFSVKFNTFQPRKDSLHFYGKVYILVDKYSYSNTVSVAAIVQDYKLGTVMGEPTADVATTYGATHEIRLPNTGLNVSYPKALIVRPNGDTRSKGVTPEVILADNPFTPQDEMLEDAIKYIHAH